MRVGEDQVTPKSAEVESITANLMPGVDRALATARRVTIAGVDLHGAEQILSARICKVGPFLALKLHASGDRQQPNPLHGGARSRPLFWFNPPDGYGRIPDHGPTLRRRYILPLGVGGKALLASIL